MSESDPDPDPNAWVNRVHTGDAMELLDQMPEKSVHAIVTDPPYNFDGGFMSRDWDDVGTPEEFERWCEAWAEKALRAIRPGGHLLAFGSTQSFHRLTAGIEDAGFEIRDVITWLYGGGFPKSLDASKAIDDLLFRDWLEAHPDERARLEALDQSSEEYAALEAELRERAGVAREEIGVKPGHEEFAERSTNGHLGGDGTNEDYKRPWMERDDADAYHVDTAPGSEEAREWDGWKTALKPAVEFITVARAPIETDTIAENILRYGTGLLNIRPSRIEISDGGGDGNWSSTCADHDGMVFDEGCGFGGGVEAEMNEEGRYPPNLVLDERGARTLDRSTNGGTGNDADLVADHDRALGPDGTVEGDGPDRGGEPRDDADDDDGDGATDGPSRFFKTVENSRQHRFKYAPKASKSERTLDGRIENDHPAVKPVELCEWLTRLVTAPDQIVLDPFCGTGTTLRACRNLGRDFVGIEMDDRWADVSRARVGVTPKTPQHLTSDGQTALGQFDPSRSGDGPGAGSGQ